MPECRGTDAGETVLKRKARHCVPVGTAYPRARPCKSRDSTHRTYAQMHRPVLDLLLLLAMYINGNGKGVDETL